MTLSETVARWQYQAQKILHPLSAIALEITTRCNLACRHCCIRRLRPDVELPYAAIEDMLATLPHHGWRKPFISVTGGEPFCHSRFGDIIELLERSGCAYSLCSNGTGIDAGWVERLSSCRRLRALGISIDGDAGTHEWLRGVQTYGPAVRALTQLAERSGKRLTVKTVLHRENLDTMDSVWQLVRRLRISIWHVLPLMAGNEAVLQSLALSAQQQGSIRARLISYATAGGTQVLFGELGDVRRQRQRVRCRQGITACTVTATGEVMACPHAPPVAQISAGVLTAGGLAAAWKSGFSACRQPDWQACAHHERELLMENA
ncbi:MAG TPA: radical SAM protein [bacterium]|nr:radical SAM protein [bacterium]